MVGWKEYARGGSVKEHPLITYVPQNKGDLVKTRIRIVLPNCDLDTALEWTDSQEKRSIFDKNNVEGSKTTKNFGMNTKQIHVQLKVIRPIGKRDLLIESQTIKHNGEGWMVMHSVEDQDTPISEDQLRIYYKQQVHYFKPRPDIQGVEVTITDEFDFKGLIPNKFVEMGFLREAMNIWSSYQNEVIKACRSTD